MWLTLEPGIFMGSTNRKTKKKEVLRNFEKFGFPLIYKLEMYSWRKRVMKQKKAFNFCNDTHDEKFDCSATHTRSIISGPGFLFPWPYERSSRVHTVFETTWFSGLAHDWRPLSSVLLYSSQISARLNGLNPIGKRSLIR